MAEDGALIINCAIIVKE